MKYYITITGLNYRYGTAPFQVGQKVKLVKEPENEHDREAIRVELPGLGKVGYVANSTHTVIGDCSSAGRIYDKIGDTAVAKVKYVLDKAVVCKVKARRGAGRGNADQACHRPAVWRRRRRDSILRRRGKMGKLTIEGEASKEYAYDVMEISVAFRATKGSSAAALERVMKQSEKFLELLEQAGVSIENIRIAEDSVKDITFDEKIRVEARRALKICTPFNMDFANYVREIVQKSDLDTDVSTQYKFSNPEKIQDELIKLALEDSKEKATYIAGIMGQTIVGIDSVEIGHKKLRPFEAQKKEDGIVCYEELTLEKLLSRRLQAPQDPRVETVQVVWNIE